MKTPHRQVVQPMNPMVFRAASLAHVLTACTHVVALARPVTGESPARHALFVAINLCVAVGFWRRPWWFTPLFGLLTLQQLVSHGGSAIHAWTTERRVDVVSLLVIVWMPTALVLLWRDQHPTLRTRADNA